MSGVLHGVMAAMQPDYVTSLLQFEGSNGSTTVTDSKLSANWSVTGATISTAQKKSGNSSLLISNNNQYINAPANTQDAFAYGTGNFCIEMWIRPTSIVNPFSLLLDNSNSGSTVGPRLLLIYKSSTQADVVYQAGGVSTKAGVVSVNTWSHLAFSRQGSTVRIFVDGIQVGTSTNSTNHTGGSSGFPRLGAGWNTGDAIRAYIDDFRVTKGVARYTSNFTPPGPL